MTVLRHDYAAARAALSGEVSDRTLLLAWTVVSLGLPVIVAMLLHQVGLTVAERAAIRREQTQFDRQDHEFRLAEERQSALEALVERRLREADELIARGRARLVAVEADAQAIEARLVAEIEQETRFNRAYEHHRVSRLARRLFLFTKYARAGGHPELLGQDGSTTATRGDSQGDRPFPSGNGRDPATRQA
jgi:hypothetical protein